MTEPTKPQAEIIVVPRARLAFARLTKAEQSRDSQGNPRGTAKFSCTLLLDPSNVEQKATIDKIKAAAAKAVTAKWGDRANWPKANPATGMGGLILCFGNGNDLPKVYDGYKDMFYVKCSDTRAPSLGSRRGEWVQYDHQDGEWYVLDKKKDSPTYGQRTGVKSSPDICPYSGSYVSARISPWVYFPTQKRPQSANGVNMNITLVQMIDRGSAFGGGPRTVEPGDFDESMAGDAPGSSQADDDIPF